MSCLDPKALAHTALYDDDYAKCEYAAEALVNEITRLREDNVRLREENAVLRRKLYGVEWEWRKEARDE